MMTVSKSRKTKEVEKLFQIKGVEKHMITKCNAPRLDHGLPC